MSERNLSTDVEFITIPEREQGKRFGSLGAIPNLAMDPESTGAAMLSKSLVDRKVASRGDLRRAPSRERPAAEMGIDEHELDLEGILDSEKAQELLERVTFGEVEGRRETGRATVREETAPGLEEEVEYEVQIDASDFLPAWFLETGLARARAVCKIETSGIDFRGRQGGWSGTGFLVSENMVMTNHHVLNSRDVCENAVCIFNYQTDERGKLLSTKTFHLNPQRLFLTSPARGGLDFTVCWVDGQPGKEFGSVPIYRHAFTITNNDCANIVQHPAGRPKAVVVQQNEVRDQNAVAAFYRSDTLPGSSGSSVFNNAWRLTALHHASKKVREAQGDQGAVYLNEGIKLSAIAAYLESLTQGSPDQSAANEVLALFNGTDALMGFFGALGRPTGPESTSALERVVDSYQGEATDVDVGFWNIEWFNKFFRDKIAAVAQVVMEMNLDVWVLEESSPEATKALVQYLNERYHVRYDSAASEPGASSAKQTTTIIWNTDTVTCSADEWPEKIQRWFSWNSKDFTSVDDLSFETDEGDEVGFEAVEGKIFDRYPGLFHVRTTQRREGDEFDFYVVPLHLKARAEGSKRRQLASRILAVAVQTMIVEGSDSDWILGGDLNATLASGDLTHLSEGGLRPVSARDEEDRAFTYVKAPYRSLIDHVFLSPNLSKLVPDDDFFIVAKDKTIPKYKEISDHRPVLVRLSLGESPRKEDGEDEPLADHGPDAELRDALRRLSRRPRRKPRGPAPGRRSRQPQAGGSAEDALNELTRSRGRDYFDERSDEIAKRQYYGDLPAGGDGAALFDHLSRLVQQTHATHLAYRPAQYLYPWVDLQPDGRSLRNVYSGEAGDPEAYIRADFDAEQRREEEMERLAREEHYDFESATDVGAQRVLESLESDFPFNCEHVVPQSWFRRGNPMRGDLHHLFACTPRCNSFRGNIPYFEFTDWEEAVQDACGKRESNEFEPMEGKGAVARATLYFLLRYPGKIVPENARVLVQRVPTLLSWHLTEPVSLHERHRNAAIQELQGNRNPLIDFPKLGTRINFTRGLGV